MRTDIQGVAGVLAGCDTLIFDLDGTLYSDRVTAGRFLSGIIERAGATDQLDSRREALAGILSGAHPTLRLGEFIRPDPSALPVSSVPYAEVVREHPDPRLAGFVLLWDTWTAVYAVTVDLAVSRETYIASFHEARTALSAGELSYEPSQDLIEALEQLRRDGRRLLLHTNSGEDSGWSTLQFLGLDTVFDEYLFSAAKPDGMTERLLGMMAVAAPHRIASIGDHYYNDIEPALRLGATTVLVSHVAPPDGVVLDGWLPDPTALARVLGVVASRTADTAEGRST